MCRSVKPVSRSVPIDDRRAVFTHFNALKDRSAEQLVAGSVHGMKTSTRLLGYITVMCRRV